LAKPLLERIRNTIVNLLKEAKVAAADIESVEIVGGSTRIPTVKQVVQEVFGKPPMTTMNADESVSRGCTLMCAILSPTFKVKEFTIEDCQPFPITLSWHGAINEDNEVEVFSRWNAVPSTKMLSFYKKEPLVIEARYSYPNDIPFSESRIGQYCIEQIQPQPDGTPSKIKVKVRLNRNGIFDITQASLIESIEEEIPTTPAPEETMETENKAAAGPAPPTSSKTTENGADHTAPGAEQMDEGNTPSAPTNSGDAQQDDNKEEETDDTKKKTTLTPKKKKKEIDLPISSRVQGATKNELERLFEHELEMISQDRKEKERSDAKNAVEEYVYDMRGKLEDAYEKYADKKLKEKLLNDLKSTEDWLYDDGMNQEKNIYVDRLKSLKNLGDPIRNRYNEAEQRQYHLQELMKALQRVDEAIQIWQTKSNDKYSHIDQADMEKVQKMLNEKQKWYDISANKINAMKLHEDPVILCSQIKQERDTFEKECWTILNKPKPKVELPKDTPKQETTADGQQNPPPPPPPSSSSNKKSSPSKNQNQQQPTDQQQPSMEVD